MKIFVLLLFILVGMTVSLAKGKSGESSLTKDGGQHLGRRYAESTIASDISKIVDSMVQKNFVKFLLNQREKKSKFTEAPEDVDLFNNILEEKFAKWIKDNKARIQ